jgi:3-phosphoshikimate 1-carboxyvinyltransferase
MQTAILPAQKLAGSVRLPGDKSVSHRAAMLAAISEGSSFLRNYSSGADCHSTLGCLRALGVGAAVEEGGVRIEGVGLRGLRASATPLDAGNSGSTIRMLSGILAGQPFATTIIGDESLSGRPMRRIMAPLRQMGAAVEAREDQFPPLQVTGRVPLTAIDYTPPVPSAQVKTCVLFAGLFSDGVTTVREAVQTRDHTEMALREFGAEVETENGSISVRPEPRLTGREFVVPGDLSSAAFFLVASLVVPDSHIRIEGVGLNPSRTALLDYLAGLGAPIRIARVERESGEMTGDLEVSFAPTRRGSISGALAAALIDELPVLAVLGALGGGVSVRDAAELRVKETDRIATVAENFRRAGLEIDVLPDGFDIPGGQRIQAAQFDSFGDHRIAMAFSVAALTGPAESVILDADAASVSFPEFYHRLTSLAG